MRPTIRWTSATRLCLRQRGLATATSPAVRLPDQAVDFIDEVCSKAAHRYPDPSPSLKEREERIRYLSDQELAAAERSDYEKAAELRTERLRL